MLSINNFVVRLVIWAVLAIATAWGITQITGCEDDCESGEMSCQGATIVTCVSGGWEEHQRCGEAINFDLELTPLQCCAVDGAPEMMECRESCDDR